MSISLLPDLNNTVHVYLIFFLILDLRKKINKWFIYSCKNQRLLQSDERNGN